MRKRISTPDFSLKNIWPERDVQDNIVSHLKSLTNFQREIFGRIASYFFSCDSVHVSQSTLALEVGCCRYTVIKALDKLEGQGLIMSCYRHYDTKLYKLSPFFLSKKVIWRLKSLFVAFRAAYLVLLTQLKILGKRYKEKKRKEHRNWAEFRKEMRMNEMLRKDKILNKIKSHNLDENPISEAIRSIKGLNLTKWGQIRLSAFDDETIYAVSEEFNKHAHIRKPFNWFIAACKRYSQAHKRPTDWGWVRDLEIAFKMPLNASMVQTETPFSRPQATPCPPPSYKAEEKTPKKVKSYERWIKEKEAPVNASLEEKKILDSNGSDAAQKLNNLWKGDNPILALQKRVIKTLYNREQVA